MDVPQTKKKLQHRKAPGAPKRFKSSYIFFVQERHKQIQEAAAQRRRQTTGSQLVEESSMEEGKRMNVEAMTKTVSSEWNALSEEEKSIYQEMARKDNSISLPDHSPKHTNKRFLMWLIKKISSMKVKVIIVLGLHSLIRIVSFRSPWETNDGTKTNFVSKQQAGGDNFSNNYDNNNHHHIHQTSLEGGHHKPIGFHFLGRHFLDSIVIPPKQNDDYTGVYIVMLSFELKVTAPTAKCRFFNNSSSNTINNSNNKLPTSYDYESPFELAEAGEAYRCLVPYQILKSIRPDQEHLPLVIASGTSLEKSKDEDKEIEVIQAALWPWHNRHRHYDVAVNNMNNDVTCDGGNSNNNNMGDGAEHQLQQERHCFHDWILWNRNYGVEHFFIYDNLSSPDHPWLQAANMYKEEGILTLIHWPYYIGGPDNNMAQRVSMNHAMYAVSGRVKWLGYFDVDEFLVPRSLLEQGNSYLDDPKPTTAETESSSVFQSNVVEMLDAFASTKTSDESSYLGVAIPMHDAQHPSTCSNSEFLLNQIDDTSNRTTRLARCLAFHNYIHEAYSKVFVRVGRDGPKTIISPHDNSQDTGFAMARCTMLSMVHFTTKRGCQNFQGDCERIDTIAMSREVRKLEDQLVLIDQGTISPCESRKDDGPCY